MKSLNTQNQLNQEAKALVQKHVQASLVYLENAQIMLRQKEAGKASELLWGSVALAIQAIADSKNIPLKNHRSLTWFVATITRELADKTINKAYYQAEALQSNFHTVDLTVEDVASNLDAIKNLVSKLLLLIPRELMPQT